MFNNFICLDANNLASINGDSSDDFNRKVKYLLITKNIKKFAKSKKFAKIKVKKVFKIGFFNLNLD